MTIIVNSIFAFIVLWMYEISYVYKKHTHRRFCILKLVVINSNVIPACYLLVYFIIVYHVTRGETEFEYYSEFYLEIGRNINGITKEKEFILLLSILDLGGEGTKKEVLDNIEQRNFMIYEEDELQKKHNRNEIKWRNDLAFTRKGLQSKGYIDGKVRNCWKVTTEGRMYFYKIAEEYRTTNLDCIKITSSALQRAYTIMESIINNLIEKNEPKEYYETEYIRQVLQRIGQSVFKDKLLKIECRCKLCKVDDKRLLIASHIKPWKDSTSIERLDSNNGFLLCPNHDKLFDQGYITFSDKGKIELSDTISEINYRSFGIAENLMIQISPKQEKYLQWHRKNVFKGKIEQ